MAKAKKSATGKKQTKKSLALQVDAEIEAIRSRVLRRREYLELLETELGNTRAIVQEFAQLYNERIGPLETEQKRLRQLLDQWAIDLAPPANGWRGQADRAKRKAGQNGDNRAKEETLPKKKQPKSIDAAYERKVRDLFRRLAKQYHPDLAKDEEDKKELAKVMAEINQAYMAKDLKALESLAHAHTLSDKSSPLPAAELARLKLELRQLDAMIFEIEQTIRELDLSPAMQMRADSADGRPHRRDILREMETDYRERIQDLREQLEGLGIETEKK